MLSSMFDKHVVSQGTAWMRMGTAWAQPRTGLCHVAQLTTPLSSLVLAADASCCAGARRADEQGGGRR